MQDPGMLIQQEEDHNFEACTQAFRKAWPAKIVSVAHDCDGGEWRCRGCPWKDWPDSESYDNGQPLQLTAPVDLSHSQSQWSQYEASRNQS